ncbi:alpha/beta-hydrolase [Polyplosphaeria fusca]|uniref:Alpha/beta-hydrolase n=1 Tax=Polyplosphaeria fusca TaxID=682080 RepID=A0A9P4UVT8_9PLEO|nr:alpha/beta-hydrolase [Polyplosphaeria fusca]
MILSTLIGLSALLEAVSASTVPRFEPYRSGFNLQTFKIDLAHDVHRMLRQVNETDVSNTFHFADSSAGITLEQLQSLRSQWLSDFDWNKEQAALNEFHHFTAEVEKLTVHFIHEKSNRPNAIPLILNHGWPGSFLEFVPVINNLTQMAKTSTGQEVAFDVVVPSLPGYAFSSAPPLNWTVDDTARVFNTLMTKVLGYSKYAVHGTDWGSGVAYSLYDNFNASVRATHLAFAPFHPATPEQLAAQNISLSPTEQFEESEAMNWNSAGSGYFYEQTTKPNTIGLALYDNPVGQLAWIGEKFQNWSDPRAGTGPSVLTNNEILKGVSLYVLTKSIISSIYIYWQNPNGFKSSYSKAHTDAPLLFSAFKYNIAFWPPALVQTIGNLVYYQNHDFGGHFAGLDNPPALISDLREIGTYWK